MNCWQRQNQMTREVPTYIGFEEYSEHVPDKLPLRLFFHAWRYGSI